MATSSSTPSPFICSNCLSFGYSHPLPYRTEKPLLNRQTAPVLDTRYGLWVDVITEVRNFCFCISVGENSNDSDFRVTLFLIINGIALETTLGCGRN